MKFSTKLTFLVLGAVLLPLLALGSAVYLMQKQVIEKRLQQQLQQQGIAATQHIRDHLLENYRDLALVAGSSTLRPPVWTPEYGLNRYLASFPMYDALIYTDQNGKLIAHAGSPLLTEGDLSLEQAASNWHQAALQGIKVIDRVTPKQGAMSRYLVFVRQVSDPGIVHGWVFAQVDSEKIVNLIEQAKIGETGRITLFNRTGRLIGHPNKSRYGFDMSAYPIMRKPVSEGVGDPGNFFVSGDGREKWGLTMMLPDQPEFANLRWGVIVDQTRAELYEPITDLRNTIVLGSTAFGIAFTLFGLLFARRLIAPLFSIKRSLNAFFDYLSGKSEPPAHLDIAGDDEFAQMAKAIDESIELQAINISKAREVEAVRDEALSRLNKISARLPGLVFQFRMLPDGGFCLPYASDAINAVYRLKAEDLHDDAASIFSVVHPDDLADHLASIRSSAQKLTPWQNEYRLKFADGTERWLYVNATPERESDGSTLWHGFVTDITEQKRAEIERHEVETRYQTIIQTSLDGFWIMGTDGRILEANDAYCRMIGYSRDELQQMSMTDLEMCESVEQTHQRIQTVIACGGDHFESKHRHKDGHVLDVDISTMYHSGSAGGVLYAFMRDITDRKRMEEQIRQLAFYDPLTKLPNRRLLHDRLSLALATSKRNGCYGALLFLDLDNFKPLNDTYGHKVGDLLLIEAARRLQSSVRTIDTVSRFGGDEFVVIISQLEPSLDKSVEQVRRIAEKIRTALSETYLLTGTRQDLTKTLIEHHCTVSIGVEMFIDHVEKLEDLMKWADAAMYHAKEAGRNQIRFYSEHVGRVNSQGQ